MRNVNFNSSFPYKIKKHRFILTMRNVNNKYKKVLELLEQFYINYEECKCFNLQLSFSLIIEFYINYEECKSCSSIVTSIFSLSFILTMRNVNVKFFL